MLKKTNTKALVIDTEGAGRIEATSRPSAAARIPSGAAASEIALASRELTGVRRAAIAASHRMASLERDADAIHAKTLLSCSARVVSTPDRGVHALIIDDCGVTVEISGGSLMASVAKTND